MVYARVTVVWGSSPRMRGTPVPHHPNSRRHGIIPAYAGNTSLAQSYWRVRRDHPRVCGEHVLSSIVLACSSGSSPRMRGTPHILGDALAVRRIIPAYAGNTMVESVSHVHRGDHPRVCGEHRSEHHRVPVLRGSSPRMRGTLRPAIHSPRFPGIIPAYAGNTLHAFFGS